MEIVINKTKNNKAPGEDRITYEFFKNSSKKYLKEVVKTFSVIFEKEEIDKSFLNSIVYPIHKKGDKSIVSNYRGISFMNCIAKILMGVITQRNYDWAERKMF